MIWTMIEYHIESLMYKCINNTQPHHPSDSSQRRDCQEKMSHVVHLSTESVDGLSLSLESVDDIERCDSLSLGVLSVGDCVSDDTLQEGLENSSGFLVDKT